MRIATIGFAGKSARQFFRLLQEAGIRRIVDVRLHNTSQLSGFAKRDDLAWFAGELYGMEYVHESGLAPTNELLREYRQKRINWKTYESRFLALMKERRIEFSLSKETMDNGCLLCSEDQPHHCHRRLVAEYLDSHWGGLAITHLGLR